MPSRKREGKAGQMLLGRTQSKRRAAMPFFAAKATREQNKENFLFDIGVIAFFRILVLQGASGAFREIKNEGNDLMNSQNHRQSAQILQFPPDEVRARLASQRQAKWKSKPEEMQLAPAIFGGAWYHEAAIVSKDGSKSS